MWGGGKGSGWDRTQDRAWSQYNDRQKQQNPWQQQAQGGGGWSQSGGGRSTQAANAWDANAYKRAATGLGGGGGIGRWMGGGQREDQYMQKPSVSYNPSTGSARTISGSESYYQQQREEQWAKEQQKMEQERARREHQQAMAPSHQDFMNQMQSLQQMMSMFPQGWGDDYFKRVMSNLVTKYFGALGGPMSNRDSAQYSWDKMGSYTGW